MKHILLLLLLLPFTSGAQVVLRNTIRSTGAIVIATGASIEGDGVFGLYRYDAAATTNEDSIWVIKPFAVGTGDPFPETGRWIAVTNPRQTMYMKTVTTPTYTVLASDFNKMLVMTYNGARTITMPPISIVNAPVPVWIKDGSNSAGMTPIIINATDSIDNGFTSTVNTNNGVIGISLNATGTKYLQQ